MRTYRSVRERRAYVYGLLDSGAAISPVQKREIAEMFGCSATAVHQDIAHYLDPLTGCGVREASAVSGANRRARECGATGILSVSEWRALLAEYNHKCLACGERKPLGPDHVIPLTKGGTNVIDNIQPLCFDCNNRKRQKSVDYRPRKIAVRISPDAARSLRILTLSAQGLRPGITEDQIVEELIESAYDARLQSVADEAYEGGIL